MPSCSKLGDGSKADNNCAIGVINDGKGRDGSNVKCMFERSVDASGLGVNRWLQFTISMASMIDSLLWLTSLKITLVLLTRSERLRAIL